jgi:hypothetical protein
MATETAIKELGEHEGVVADFFANIPHNRKDYKPPKGYDFVQHKSHHSRQVQKGRGKGLMQTYAPRVGSDLTEGKVLAKSVSKWFGTGKNYIIFSSMLVYKGSK